MGMTRCSIFQLKMVSQSTSARSDESPLLSPPVQKIGRPCDSAVWEHFSFDADRGKSVYLVGTCGVELAGKFPTNLKAHLKRNHSTVHQELLG